MPEKRIVFVCTGNVCRSPMAEYMLRDRLGPRTDWIVASAGLHAGAGMPASRAAIDALAEDGIDLSPHRSRPLDRPAVDAASVIVVMTGGHREEMRMLYPDALGKVFLLKSFGGRPGDVVDPIGSPGETYREVRDEVAAALPDLMAFLRELHTA